MNKRVFWMIGAVAFAAALQGCGLTAIEDGQVAREDDEEFLPEMPLLGEVLVEADLHLVRQLPEPFELPAPEPGKERHASQQLHLRVLRHPRSLRPPATARTPQRVRTDDVPGSVPRDRRGLVRG